MRIDVLIAVSSSLALMLRMGSIILAAVLSRALRFFLNALMAASEVDSSTVTVCTDFSFFTSFATASESEPVR